ncbi:MAG: hypothetical protein KatS3mg113_0167 [Planctomycetaceae bacterium]|nr:MAG: hypothetical protein KatS3mg113_0167 [Planctomycetaceae bacterium]
MGWGWFRNLWYCSKPPVSKPPINAAGGALCLHAGGVSIKGNFRENNEDRLYIDPTGRFLLVADGMGGQLAGERASELALEYIRKELERHDWQAWPHEEIIKLIDDAVHRTNEEIMAVGALDVSLQNMGTTIAFLLWTPQACYAGGVGDSRVYHWRSGKLAQLTTDHSLVQALLEAGTITQEEAAHHRFRNMLYRYLGAKEGGQGTQPRRLEVQLGDRFVLCTDGVTGGVTDEQLCKLLAEGKDPEELARRIVSAAERGGSRDNITCIVAIVEPAPSCSD